MVSLLVNYSLDVVMGVAWWVTKTSGKGIYYGYSYLMYGSEEEKTEIEMTDIKELTAEIRRLRNEVSELKDEKISKEIILDEDSDESYNIIDKAIT